MTEVSEIVNQLIKQQISHINTTFPAKVTKVNTCTCDVKPKFYHEYTVRGEKFKRDMPILRDVPVIWPRGGNSLILMPIAVDDVVLVSCSQVSLANMLTDLNDIKVKPSSFHLEDAVILGGFILGNECGTAIAGSSSPTNFEIPSIMTVVSTDDIKFHMPEGKKIIIKYGNVDRYRIGHDSFDFYASLLNMHGRDIMDISQLTRSSEFNWESGATPSVAGYDQFYETYDSLTDITNFVDGVESQAIHIRGTSGNFRINNNVNIVTLSGANITLANGNIIIFQSRGGKWRHIGGQQS